MKIPKHPFKEQQKIGNLRLYYFLYNAPTKSDATDIILSSIPDNDAEIARLMDDYNWDGTYSNPGGIIPNFFLA